MKYTIKKIDRRYKASYLHGCTHKLTFEKEPPVYASARERSFYDAWWFVTILSDIRHIVGPDIKFGWPGACDDFGRIWTVTSDSQDYIYVKDLDAFESAMLQYKLTKPG